VVQSRTIEDAILTAQMYTENARFYSFVADTSDKFAALSFTCRPPGNFPEAREDGAPNQQEHDEDARRGECGGQPGLQGVTEPLRAKDVLNWSRDQHRSEQ